MDRASLNRFFRNECSESERKNIIRWFSDPGNDLIIKYWMQENWDVICTLDLSSNSDNPDIEKIWSSIQGGIQNEELIVESTKNIPEHNFPQLSIRTKVKRFTAAAAIIIAILSVTYYLLLNKSGGKNITAIEKPIKLQTDIAPPAEDKAVLTLADGSKVYLDSADNGILAKQGHVQIIKKSNGEILYTGSGANTIAYNTLSLPRGSKPIHLVLSDGSVVWLNAASSVTYPTAFIGNIRNVTITGEAYFQVAKNPAMPFYVSHHDMVVKVLGTHFNVNAYSDDQVVKVTLLEGIVDVSLGQKKKQLKPGQQACLSEGNIQLNKSVDLEEVMAWKNNQFYFTGTNIQTIMHQIERYYNVKVQYRDNVPYKFVAKISRDVSISQFLEKLELTNLVHFKIEGDTIIVSK